MSLSVSFYFSIGVLVYKSTQDQNLLYMEEEWKAQTIVCLKWKLVKITGKVTRHGRQVMLKLIAPLEKLVIFLKILRLRKGRDVLILSN